MSTRREFVGHLAASAAATTLLTGSALVLEGCTTDWITTAINDLPTIVSVVSTVAQIVADAAGAGAAAPAIAAVIATAAQAATVALNLVKTLVADYKANPSATTLEKIKTTLLDVQSQIGSILDASRVFDPTLRAIITTGLGVGITVLTQIMSLIPSASTASLTAQTKQVTKTAMKPWKSQEIVDHFNAFADAHGYSKYHIKLGAA